MAFVRQVTLKNQKKIILEFPGNWNEDTDLNLAAEKELFLQGLMAGLCALAGKAGHFKFASMRLNDTHDHYKVLINEKDSYDDMLMIFVPAIVPEEQKNVSSTTSWQLRDCLTEKEAQVATELGIPLKIFVEWKNNLCRLVISATEDFSTYLAQISDNIHFQNTIKATDFEKDPKIKIALDKMQVITNELQQKIQQKINDFSKMKSHLEKTDEAIYQAHFKKILLLLQLKGRLIHILNQTAIEYYKKIQLADGTVKLSDAKHFNNLFEQIAKIEEHEIQSENFVIRNKNLKEICDQLNHFLQKIKIAHFWIGRVYEPQAVPFSIFNDQVKQLTAEYKKADLPFHYQEASFNLTQYTYCFEEETEKQCAALRYQFAETYSEVLQKEQQGIDELKQTVGVQMNALTQFRLKLANYMETIKPAVQENLVTPSEKADNEPPSYSETAQAPIARGINRTLA